MSKPPMVGFAANLCLDDLIRDLGDPWAPHRLFPQGRRSLSPYQGVGTSSVP